MARFKLVKGAGPHKVGFQIFTQGNVVESEADLVKLFPGKFECIGGGRGAAEEEGDKPKAISETRTPYDTNKAPKEGAPVTVEGEALDEDEPLESESGEGAEGETGVTRSSYSSRRKKGRHSHR